MSGGRQASRSGDFAQGEFRIKVVKIKTSSVEAHMQETQEYVIPFTVRRIVPVYCTDEGGDKVAHFFKSAF
jgi:hypothetical protein